MIAIYLDNAAAAPVSPEMARCFAANAVDCFANQEAVHGLAYQVRSRLKEAAAIVATALTGDEKAVVCWGTTGTALFNLTACYPGFAGGNVVTSPLEHPALLAALRRSGAEVRLTATKHGKITPDGLRPLLDRNTRAVFLHQVQSETGMVQDLVTLGAAVREWAPQAWLAADTVQSIGKLPVPWWEAGLDLIYCSGHKIGAPGGAAAICRPEKLSRFLTTARNADYLDGRPEPALCLTLAEAIRRAAAALPERRRLAAELKALMIRELAGLPQVRVTVPPEQASPFILHLLVPGYQTAVLVRMLSERGVHVAAGSACQAESNRPSAVLLNLGYRKSEAYSGLRISLWDNTEPEIVNFCRIFRECLLNY